MNPDPVIEFAGTQADAERLADAVAATNPEIRRAEVEELARDIAVNNAMPNDEEEA